jgi:two-component system sensor histidine kinase DesK
VLVYLPVPWWGWEWVPMQACLIASAPMVLRRGPAAAAVAAMVLGTDLAAVVSSWREPIGAVVYWVSYETWGTVASPAALYGCVRLARAAGQLVATRAELADLAVGRERLRVSRDLHDLLGQSLSAVSLKGDLAIRLLRSDPAAARAEIAGLTGVARDALRDVRAVTLDEHAVSLRAETDAAAALLLAAAIDAHVDVALPDLPQPFESTLAWAVREGVTNVLRHSEASTCSITAGRRDRNVFLEIVNDGVPAPMGEGSGLAGLSERARALSGSVSAGHVEGGFRLRLEVPEAVA